jgi:hypothetical protein
MRFIITVLFITMAFMSVPLQPANAITIEQVTRDSWP